MEPLEWVLAFVNNISTPARQMTGSVVTLTKALKELQGVADKLRPIRLPGMSGGDGSGGGRSGKDPALVYLQHQVKLTKERARYEREYERSWQKNLRDRDKSSAMPSGFANMWTKIGARMQKDQASALKVAEPGVSKEFANMWGRIGQRMASDQTKAMNKAAKDAQRAAEAATHKSYYGGHKSIGGLFRSRAAAKTSGLATGAADAVLNAPGRLASGFIGGAAGVIQKAASLGVDLAEGAAGFAYNFGKAAISAQAMREDSVSGFTAVFGSAEEANRLFDAARTAAKQTKFDTDEVVRDYNTIAAAGFKAAQVERIYWTSADIGSARGAGRQQRYLNALSKINASPQASFGAVQQAALAGPGIGNVFEALKARTGGKDRTRKEWMKEFASGAISGTTALEAVIDATNKLYNKTTGIPGEYAKALGDKSWAGTISNIKNGLGDILNMQLEESHPINQFKKLLQSIGSSGGLFDETTARGQRFKALVSGFVSDIFSVFGGLETDIGSKMDNLLDILERVREVFHSVTEYIRLNVTPALSDMLNNKDLDAHLTEFATKLISIFVKAAGVGIYVGIKGLYYTAKQALGGAGPPGVEAAAPALPSWAFDVYPSATPSKRSASPAAAGMSLADDLPSYDIGGPVSGGYGQPQLAIVHGGEYVIPNGAGRGGASRGGMGGQMPAVHVHVHGSLGMDEDDLRLAVQQGTFSGLLQALEESAASQGAIGAT